MSKEKIKDVYEEAYKRRNDICDIPLSEVMEMLNLTEDDYKDILKMFEED